MRTLVMFLTFLFLTLPVYASSWERIIEQELDSQLRHKEAKERIELEEKLVILDYFQDVERIFGKYELYLSSDILADLKFDIAAYPEALKHLSDFYSRASYYKRGYEDNGRRIERSYEDRIRQTERSSVLTEEEKQKSVSGLEEDRQVALERSQEDFRTAVGRLVEDFQLYLGADIINSASELSLSATSDTLYHLSRFFRELDYRTNSSVSKLESLERQKERLILRRSQEKRRIESKAADKIAEKLLDKIF